VNRPFPTRRLRRSPGSVAAVETSADRPQRLFLAAAWVVWILVLLRVLHAFGPDTGFNDAPYNSDTAIPVLMANDDRPFSPYSLYYWAADRFGAWQYLLPALIHRRTGLWWTEQMVFVLHASWALLGVVVAGALSRRDRYAIPVIYLLVLCLHSESRYLFFELGQVYAWIATSLLLVWLGLRRLFDLEAQPGRWRWAVRAGLLAAMLLALLSSFTVVPYLAALLGLEALRGWLKRPAGGRWHLDLAWAGGLFATALLVERSVRRLYNQCSLEHLQHGMGWQPSFDRGFLVQNARRHLDSLAAMSWFPLYVVAALVPLVLLGWCLAARGGAPVGCVGSAVGPYARRASGGDAGSIAERAQHRRRPHAAPTALGAGVCGRWLRWASCTMSPHRVRRPRLASGRRSPRAASRGLHHGLLWRVARRRDAGLASVRSLLGDDGLLFAVGAVGIAVLNLVLVILVDHVRLSHYDTRFLSIAYQFAPVGALMTLYSTVERGLGRRQRRTGAVLVATGLLVLFLAMPERRPSPQYETVKRIAADLARKAPGAVLVGGYWETYVFASLQPLDTMTPVPLASNRTPWTVAALAAAEEVIVEYRATRLGGERGSPPERIAPYGHSLRLKDASWHVDSGYAFALYGKPGGFPPFRDGFESGDSGRWSRTVDGMGER
jgi:hypothetical protein